MPWMYKFLTNKNWFKILSLIILLSSCTDLPLIEEIQSKTEVKKAEKVEVVNNNNELPEWALWAMGGGIFCFALIIPSPFRFKGFST